MGRIICPKCGETVKTSKSSDRSFISCVEETKEEDEEWVFYHFDCRFEAKEE